MTLAICVPCRDKIEFAFFEFLFKLTDDLRSKGFDVIHCFSEDMPVDAARNECVKDAAIRKADYYLWIDSDMTCQIEKIYKLFDFIRENENSIVSGLYFQKRPSFSPVIRKINEYGIFVQEWDIKEEPFEVDGFGFGMVLMKQEEMAKIINATKGQCFVFSRELGEDLYFCKVAKSLGIKLFVHPDVDCEHYGGIVTIESYLNQKENNASGYQELARYLGKPAAYVRSKCQSAPADIAKEWNEKNPQTEEEIDEFYQSDTNYKYDLTAWWNHNKEQRTRIIKQIPKSGAAKVLDYGCGIGDYGLFFAEKLDSKADFYDISVDSLRYLSWRIGQRRLDNCKIIESIEKSKTKYDCIICMDVFEHIKDPQKLLLELKNHLKYDGLLLAFVAPMKNGQPQHISTLQIEDHGFEKVGECLYKKVG